MSKSKNPENIMTLANKITVFRIVSIPLIVIALLNQWWIWGLVLLIVSTLTDMLDGLAARVRGEKTKLGAFLDPMADKLLLTSVFWTLTFLDKIQIWVFVVVFSRDLLIVLGWAIIYILTGSSKITPRPLGKITTAVQLATAIAIILSLPNFKVFLVWTTVALTTTSAIDYILLGERRLGEWES